MVILVFMVVTIPISFVNPISGEFRDPPFIGLFYLAVAGIPDDPVTNGCSAKAM